MGDLAEACCARRAWLEELRDAKVITCRVYEKPRGLVEARWAYLKLFQRNR